MLGWAGAALVIIAYVPQIRHLYVEKCAWGISISSWLIWLVAGALLLGYSIFRSDTLFTFVQLINVMAILATIILARKSNQICPYHSEPVFVERVDKATFVECRSFHPILKRSFEATIPPASGGPIS
jgi:lipid-A-disaccharide synthase-like uncharacterized protein